MLNSPANGSNPKTSIPHKKIKKDFGEGPSNDHLCTGYNQKFVVFENKYLFNFPNRVQC